MYSGIKAARSAVALKAMGRRLAPSGDATTRVEALSSRPSPTALLVERSVKPATLLFPSLSPTERPPETPFGPTSLTRPLYETFSPIAREATTEYDGEPGGPARSPL